MHPYAFWLKTAFTLLTLGLWPANRLLAQSALPAPDAYWSARWIAPPEVSTNGYGVYHFRKTFTLAERPASFGIHVSADNRYRLFVNGKAIGEGPARGDTQHWPYDTYELAPHLQTGANVLAILVWNMGEYRPAAQTTYQTGLVVQGAGQAAQMVNTDATWRVYHNRGYQALPNDMAKLGTYIVVGPGDRVDGRQYPWGWEQVAYNDAGWPTARPYWFLTKMRGYGTDGNWMLVPRAIPFMEHLPQRFARVRRATPSDVPADFLRGTAPWVVGPHQRAVVLLDQGHLTNGYPELRVSGGRGATLRLGYAEGLVDAQRRKGHRDSIAGRTLLGTEDEFTTDGGHQRTFRPLWFRTWRYVQLEVTTQDEPLTVEDLTSEFTGYPFVEKATFASDDPQLARIWEVGWRTARLCAGETYFDCPYYEQLQYTGDTRIQALISLYVTGDDRLMRNALQQFADSRISDGLTQSRYPCYDLQIIPPFSLFWVSMVYDYWWHRQDDAFVQSFFPVIESVLDWHERQLTKEGLNGPLLWWNFTDWAWPWNDKERIGGVPAGASTGGSAILSLQLAYTMQQAARLMEHYRQPTRAAHYRQMATRIAQSAYRRCWNPTRGLLADTPEQTQYSQHANIWGILTDAVPTAQQKALLQRVMRDTTLRPATFYFKFYLFEALKKTNLGHEFVGQLEPWREMLKIGLTTFAEQPEPVRSDCHAWSASPNYQFLSLVCGINPGAPGFQTVTIAPAPGPLRRLAGTMPHPRGEISVRLEKQGTQWPGEVTLPAGVSGTFVRADGTRMPLKGGRNGVVY